MTTTTITESNNFIILDNYTKIETTQWLQTEAELEDSLIEDLQSQGYIYRKDLSSDDLLNNVKSALEELNKVKFNNNEWNRFVNEYLDKPSENLTAKTKKIHKNHSHQFKFDNGSEQNIYLFDKTNISNNRLEVIKQLEQKGKFKNRYDVTILVNGLPLVQIELKKAGIDIKEAFNQIHRYSKESFNTEHSLFKFLQIFIISNRSQTRYFANNTAGNNDSFDFTMKWARADNTPIEDLKNFTATFLEKRTLLNVLFRYSIFNTQKKLMIMRPYQIAATERILWKIQSSNNNKCTKAEEKGGFIWHTTGSGKTLTSFKAAQLATELDFIDKVFFVVDRKDLDFQTMKEYKKFGGDECVSGSSSTKKLKENIEAKDDKIIVTTIQKLNNLMKSEMKLPIYNKQVVFIFDECHRSQFGEAQKNLKCRFKNYYQFGFTGTPIFPENSLSGETTMSVFGAELHSYVITDAIRDQKVLKFKVDYNNVRPAFKLAEQEIDEKKLNSRELKEALLHPNRITEICQYILNEFNNKTHRNKGNKVFNAMLAVSSIDAVKVYYETFKRLQKDKENPLKIATIFSFAANESQNAIGDVLDESFNPETMDLSSKEFLTQCINDYNQLFKCNYSLDNNGFEKYYTNVSERTKNQEIDLLIVVGMFLTGFDAPRLNTLFVDKPLRYHGLIQAFSRTNRIYPTKAFGNIVTFRDLEAETKKAITLFGKSSKSHTTPLILERSFSERVNGYIDESGKKVRGYREVVEELNQSFGDPSNIIGEQNQCYFAKLWGEYLRLDNILQNYDEYTELKRYREDVARGQVKEEEGYYRLNNEVLTPQEILDPCKKDDYLATYQEILRWRTEQAKAEDEEKPTSIDWDEVTFEIDLLKSQDINLDYIFDLINQEKEDKEKLCQQVRKVIRASTNQCIKEDLIINFIQHTDLKQIKNKGALIEAFLHYARNILQEEMETLIQTENLHPELAKNYITHSLKNGYADDKGDGLSKCLPKMSPLNPAYPKMKNKVFQAIKDLVNKFKDIGTGF